MSFCHGANVHAAYFQFGREPLDFKEHSGTRAMESYLEKVRERHSIPAELEREIWRQKSRKVRECKVSFIGNIYIVGTPLSNL